MDPAEHRVDVLSLGEAGYGVSARHGADDELVSGIVSGLRLKVADVFRR